MPKHKHLVLDYHVHQLLVSARRRTGVSMRRIGNTILRCSLRRWATLHRLLGDALHEVAGVREDQFTRAIAMAFERLHETSQLDSDFCTGESPLQVWNGWRIRSLDDEMEGSTRVLEYTLVSHRLVAMPLHCHEEDVHLLCLNGHALLTISGSQQLLAPNQSANINAGADHSVVPLSQDIRFLATFTNLDGVSDAVEGGLPGVASLTTHER